MAAGAEPQKRFALDSNVLFDLAAGRDFAHTFREAFQEKGYSLLVPPTVVQELALKAHQTSDKEVRKLAHRALSCMREWEIDPFDVQSVGHAITEQFAFKLMQRRLLPEDEMNDGLILAETSLNLLPVIATSDSHMLGMDPAELRLVFDESDLFPVAPMHPKNLLRAMNIRFRE